MMKKMRRNYITDSGKVTWLKNNENTEEAIEVDATKANLVDAIYDRLLGHEDFSYSEINNRSKTDLMFMAKNNNLIVGV